MAENLDASTRSYDQELLPDPSKILALLAREYDTLEQINRLSITHIKFREKSPVQFLLEGESESGERVYLSAQPLPEKKGIRLAERLNLPVGNSSGHLNAHNQQRHAAVYSSVLGMLFQLFPEDRYLPALPSLIDAKSVEPIIRSALADSEIDAELICYESKVMRYKPHRKCMIRYSLRHRSKGDSARIFVYGKVSRKKYFVETREILHQLRQVVNDKDLELPHPLAVIPELCLELISAVPGKSLNELCESDKFPHCCVLTARALACFNEAQVKLSLHWTIADKIARIYKDAMALVALFPDEQQRIRTLESKLISRFRSLPVVAPQLIHRDFHGMNVLLQNDSVGFIDLEDCALGDPAEDVGSMYGHLSRLCFEQPRLAEEIARGRQLFLQGYPCVLSQNSVQSHCALYCFYQALQQLRHPQFFRRYTVSRSLLGECERVLEMSLS